MRKSIKFTEQATTDCKDYLYEPDLSINEEFALHKALSGNRVYSRKKVVEHLKIKQEMNAR